MWRKESSWKLYRTYLLVFIGALVIYFSFRHISHIFDAVPYIVIVLLFVYHFFIQNKHGGGHHGSR